MAELHQVSYRSDGGVHVDHLDDHFLQRYRELLDAEDSAFDELEHAYEDGDRATFEEDLVVWTAAIERRAKFLRTHGLPAGLPA